MPSLYHIHYKKEGELFRLYNYDEPAGERLVKSFPFPFSDDISGPAWWMRSSKADAEDACLRLQKYLDKHEADKPKTGGEK